MKEDELLAGILERQADDQRRNIELEKRYNHYGDRGVVDVVIEDYEDNAMWVIELKSDAAIAEATGANEIIRQFNKHREYFFKGTDKRYPAQRNRRNFQLIFAATDACYQHLKDNWPLYENLNGKEYCHVTIQHPDVRPTGRPFEDSSYHDGWNNQNFYVDIVDGISEPELTVSGEGASEQE